MQAASRFSTEVIERIARELVRVEHQGPASIVKTPLRYPSGAGVVVQVKAVATSFFVTDMGLGFQEAEMMGASTVFRREARIVAEASGVRFDENAFFEVDVQRDELAGAIAMIANCSNEAAILTAHRLADKKRSDGVERLYHRLITIFSERRVARDAQIVGASGTKWEVSTLVTGSDRPTIFEPVSKHHNSVYSAAIKFHDIALMPHAPKRVAVVRKKSELGTYFGILNQAGEVIEFEAANDTYSHLAEAA